MIPTNNDWRIIKSFWIQIFEAVSDEDKEKYYYDLINYCQKFDSNACHFSLGIQIWYFRYNEYYSQEYKLSKETILNICNELI